MNKKEWYEFINEQLNKKVELTNQIDQEMLNLENMNYDFAASGRIKGESIQIEVDDKPNAALNIDKKEVYSRCITDNLTPEEAIKKIIEQKIKEM